MYALFRYVKKAIIQYPVSNERSLERNMRFIHASTKVFVSILLQLKRLILDMDIPPYPIPSPFIDLQIVKHYCYPFSFCSWFLKRFCPKSMKVYISLYVFFPFIILQGVESRSAQNQTKEKLYRFSSLAFFNLIDIGNDVKYQSFMLAILTVSLFTDFTHPMGIELRQNIRSFYVFFVNKKT